MTLRMRIQLPECIKDMSLRAHPSTGESEADQRRRAPRPNLTRDYYQNRKWSEQDNIKKLKRK
jgi:hypothetical protein